MHIQSNELVYNQWFKTEELRSQMDRFIQNVVATPVIQTYEEELFGGADLNLDQLIRQSQLVLQPMVPRRVLGEVDQNLRMLNTIMNDPPDAYWCQNEQPAGDAAVTLTRVDPESKQAQAKTLIPAEPVQPGTINIADLKRESYSSYQS